MLCTLPERCVPRLLVDASGELSSVPVQDEEGKLPMGVLSVQEDEDVGPRSASEDARQPSPALRLA